MDLVGLEDKNIYAIKDGLIVFVGYDSGFGNTVVVQQIDSSYCRYSHLEVIKVQIGQRVISGENMIGIEGKTGDVYGGNDPRHLDLRISSTPYHTADIKMHLNPCEYLGFPNSLGYEVIPRSIEMTKIKNLILYKSEVDKRAAGYLADHLTCKIVEIDLLPPSIIDQVFENVYVIGSPERPVPKAINIFGTDRYDTCRKVIEMIRQNSGDG